MSTKTSRETSATKQSLLFDVVVDVGLGLDVDVHVVVGLVVHVDVGLGLVVHVDSLAAT